MVFSFFGKKDPPPKPAVKPVARPAGSLRPQVAANPPPREATQGAPDPIGSSLPAAGTGLDVAPAKDPLPSLDFTSSGVFNATQSEIASNIELQESTEQVHPLAEEAAILYANGHDKQCLEALEAAVLRSDLGSSADQLWMMLFDIYHVLDRREAFDSRALDYVVRFERSPPAWRGGDAATGTGGAAAAPMVALGVMLDAGASKQMEMLERMLAKHPSVRLDAGKVKDADSKGCGQLLASLRAARKSKCEIIVQSAASLARVLESRLAVGVREHETEWLLLLELFQQQGLDETYEEWALNYAITFEVSPPAWEPPRLNPKPGASGGSAVSMAAAPDDESFRLSGEMAGPCVAVMQQLKEHAGGRESLLIDLSGLKRIDFVAAGNLLNTLFEAGAGGKPIRLANVSALVTALLKVVGIAEAATVERRRY